MRAKNAMTLRNACILPLCIGMCAFSSASLADVATITVPEDTEVTLADAISAGYMSGVSDYDAFLAASDLVVNGPGRLIIETNLKSAGYTGEVHVVAGSVLQLRCTGALGDTAAGTFVEDGATLETYSEGEKNSLSFLGEPLTFAGTGVDGEGALVSLTTANYHRRGAWGGTVLTMTGDALVRLKGAKSNFDFPYQLEREDNKINMNGHTLTFCGPANSGLCTLPLRLNVTNPGHVVVTNNLLVSLNFDNYLRGTAENTFTVGAKSRLDLYDAHNVGGRPWTLVLREDVMCHSLCSSSGNSRWDGPVVREAAGDLLVSMEGSGTEAQKVFGDTITAGGGLTITNSTPKAKRPTYPIPSLKVEAFTGNSISGKFSLCDMSASFRELHPSFGQIDLSNADLTIGSENHVAGLLKGVNMAYASWNDTSAPSETRCREDFMNNYRVKDPTEWFFYTNSIAFGPDDAMNDSKPIYGKPSLVTYQGYLWNTGGNRVITFLTHVHGFVRVLVERAPGIWNGPLVYDVQTNSEPKGVRLSSNGVYRIAICMALHDGKGGANAALDGGHGILYNWGSSTLTSTNPGDYMPFMDPGDGSLLTVAVPGSEEYAALGFGGETPVPLAASLSASGKSSLTLGHANYSVGGLTGAVTVVNESLPRTTNVLFSVTDELHCRTADLTAGNHLTVTGALAFAEGTLLSFDDVMSLPVPGSYVIAEATEGITGMPVMETSPRRPVKLYISTGDSAKLMFDIRNKGTVLTLR